MVIITSPRFEEHVTPPGHPERMERAHVFSAVAHRWMERGGETMLPRQATREELERVPGVPAKVARALYTHLNRTGR